MEYARSRPTILVIDDMPENIDVLDGILRQDYKIKAALNGEKGLAIAMGNSPPDLILLDVMMPGMDGYEVCRRLKANTSTTNIPVIFISAKGEEVDESEGFAVGCVDYITKPVKALLVRARVRSQLALHQQNHILEQKVQERTRDLLHAQDVTIRGMAVLAEYRDNETGSHILRTQYYVRLLAQKLSLLPKYHGTVTKEMINLLYKSAPLHDIGKVGVPDTILHKQGPLNREEFEIMKKHTLYGGKALAEAEQAFSSEGSSTFLKIGKEIAYSHHEKWDGSGYPYGLKGEEIPLPGRLMALSDIYDALISKRVYKSAFSHSQAMEIITDGDGRVMPEHFDPDILQVFKDNHLEFYEIARQHSEKSKSPE